MQVSFRGDGPLQGLQAIAEATGQVKGSVGNPLADPPLQPSGKLNVGAAVGEGEYFLSSHTYFLLRLWSCVLSQRHKLPGYKCVLEVRVRGDTAPPSPTSSQLVS